MSLAETLTAVTGLLRRPKPDASHLLEAPVAAPAPALPPPSRHVTCRVKFREMYWHPVLAVADEARLVVTANAGLPHCARCDKALALTGGTGEAWTCAACGDAHPGSDADFYAADIVVAEGLRGFMAANPGFAAAPGLAVPGRALA